MPIKYAKTIKDYTAKYKGYIFVVPKGSLVTNQTACGPDDNYHFWKVNTTYIEKLTGVKNSLLLHDLNVYSLNIPQEYCEPYSN